MDGTETLIEEERCKLWDILAGSKFGHLKLATLSYMTSMPIARVKAAILTSDWFVLEEKTGDVTLR